MLAFTEEDLHELYVWVDSIPISKPKKNISRDFSDGCNVAEILYHFFPKIIELHNYVPAMSKSKKRENWQLLNNKVLKKLYFEVPPEEVEEIISAVPGAIERFLRALKIKIEQIQAKREEMGSVEGNRYAYDDDVFNNDNNINNNIDNEQFFDDHFTSNAKRRSIKSTKNDKKSPAPANSNNIVSNNAPKVVSNTNAASDPAQSDLLLLLNEKDRSILELRETVGILSEKIMKLEELVRVKDEKLNQYRAKFGK